LITRNIIIIGFLIQSFFAFGQNESILNSLKNKITKNPAGSLIIIDRLLSKNDSIVSFERAKLLEFKGEVFENNQDIQNAIEVYESSYDIYKILKHKEQQIILLNKISSLLIILENFPKVIDIQNKVAELLENNDNKEQFSSRYTSNMALMYFKTGDSKKAKFYLYKSIDNAKNKGEETLLNQHFKDLSRVFISTNQLDSALFYSNKSLLFSTKNNNYQLTSAILLNKGEIYEKMEEFTKAELEYEKAIGVLDNVGVNNAHIYINLGNFYKRLYLYEYANANLKKAIRKTEKTGNNEKILGLYQDLMENSILQRKSRSAFYYLKKYDSLYKINLKEEKKRNIDYINERYNLQKEEIIYLNNKHTLQEKESELKKNKLLNTISIILFSVLLLTSFLYYRFYKLRNEKLNLQLKNTVLRLQMNPHFIFNSLTAIQNTILKNDQLKSAELIAVFSKLIRQNLDFSNRNNISLNEEIDMLTNYLKTQQFRFNNAFSFDIDIDPKIDRDKTQIPPMLIQPFVENSIEHGGKHKSKGGKIEVSIIKTKKGMDISIIDNGVGFKTSRKYNKADKRTNKIHAIKIFKERLRIRQKNDEASLKIVPIINNKQVCGTKVSFSLKD